MTAVPKCFSTGLWCNKRAARDFSNHITLFCELGQKIKKVLLAGDLILTGREGEVKFPSFRCTVS